MKNKLTKLNDALFNDENVVLSPEQMKTVVGGTASEDPTDVAVDLTATHMGGTSGWNDMDNDGGD